MAAVAEKFVAENAIGVALLPIEPLLETSTTVLAFDTCVGLFKMLAPDINVNEPVLAVIVELVSETEALAPLACRITLLPFIVAPPAKDIVSLTAPGAKLSSR